MQSRSFRPVPSPRRTRVLAVGLSLIWMGKAFVPLALAATTQIHQATATPAIVTFFANDPDAPFVPASVSATINFRTTGGSPAKAWSLEVQAAGGPNLASCPSTVPINRITAACVSATADDGGTGSCNAPFTLSTSPQVVASGVEGTGNATPYVVIINFTFQDSWRYIATNTPCSVSLTYRIIAA